MNSKTISGLTSRVATLVDDQAVLPSDGGALCALSGLPGYAGLDILSSPSFWQLPLWKLRRGGALASGAWVTDGIAICTAAQNQTSPNLVSDGSGGAIVVWQDSRMVGTAAIYSQRVSGAGVFAWDANGRSLCSACSASPVGIVSDGQGGAIVAWSTTFVSNR